MIEDKIIGALIGLVGACNNNPKTENTDRLIIKALAFSHSPFNSACTAEKIIDEIHAEKYEISPGCAHCQTPCGNTSDYDMRLIYNAADEIRKIKLDILLVICEAASYIRQNDTPLSDADVELLYKALSYISYDLKSTILLELLSEAKALKTRIEEK